MKRIYTRVRLDQQVLIDTRSSNPIIFYLSTHVPVLNAWFTVTNMTNLKWKIHDFSAEIWLGQPLATATCHDRPPDISRKTRDDVFTKCELNEFQVNRAKEWKDRQNKGQGDNVTIHVNARLESTVGLIEFKTTLENRPVLVQ
ncbi:hypothetical protein MUP05_06795 [Candidatus Bathyarchaeota archaeon]|nr:hypothetical protein [Candidatus Bathyarchaeota archaeon]